MHNTYVYNGEIPKGVLSTPQFAPPAMNFVLPALIVNEIGRFQRSPCRLRYSAATALGPGYPASGDERSTHLSAVAVPAHLAPESRTA